MKLLLIISALLVASSPALARTSTFTQVKFKTIKAAGSEFRIYEHKINLKACVEDFEYGRLCSETLGSDSFGKEYDNVLHSSWIQDVTNNAVSATVIGTHMGWSIDITKKPDWITYPEAFEQIRDEILLKYEVVVRRKK